MKKYKLGYTEGLNNLVTYINTSKQYVTYKDLLQYSVDFECFIDFYMNLNLLDRLIIEKNKLLLQEKKTSA